MKCIKCGIEFEIKRKQSDLCRRCRLLEYHKIWNQNNPEKHKANVKKWNDKVALKKGPRSVKPKDPIECTNPRCKKQFTPTHWKQKYCSRQCGNYFHNNKKQIESGLPVVDKRRGPNYSSIKTKTNRTHRYKPERTIHLFKDSPLTLRGDERQRIYIKNGGGKEAKRVAMIDFNAQKTPLNHIEKIPKFKRVSKLSFAYGRDTKLERQEVEDAIAQGYPLIRWWTENDFLKREIKYEYKRGSNITAPPTLVKQVKSPEPIKIKPAKVKPQNTYQGPSISSELNYFSVEEIHKREEKLRERMMTALSNRQEFCGTCEVKFITESFL